jgi:glycosyltransferase involved in cell wall biosynthesis
VLKISVIIPSYNQGKFLEETILSVLEQDYRDLELFIIDGGSKDNSVEIIQKYSSHITGWVSEKDSGQSEAINKGFRMSSGDIISWLCSDDLYTPGTLKKVNEIFASLPPSVGVVHGNSVIFQGEKVVNYDKGYGKWTVERQLAGMTFPQPSSFMKRTFVEQAGLLKTDYHFGMDYELFSRLIMICDFHYEDIFFSRYRLHNDSKSTTSIAKFIEEWIVIFNSIVEGLNIESIKSELNKAGLTSVPDKSIVHFFSGLKTVKNLVYEKMLFYFLVNVIRYDYATGKFDRAKSIGTLLKNDFSNYLKFEPTIIKIINRLNILPAGLLKVARNIKRILP